MSTPDTARCPCRKKSETVTYAACCARYHRRAAAPTPEALMRSRYTAFALHNAAYLLATWDPSTRPATMEFEAGRDWYMLKVIASAQVGDTGTVSFVARSRLGGRVWALEEVSRFVRDGGRWYYIEGLTNA